MFVFAPSIRAVLSRIERARCHIHAGNEGFVAARARQLGLAATGRVIEIEANSNSSACGGAMARSE